MTTANCNPYPTASEPIMHTADESPLPKVDVDIEATAQAFAKLAKADDLKSKILALQPGESLTWPSQAFPMVTFAGLPDGKFSVTADGCEPRIYTFAKQQ